MKTEEVKIRKFCLKKAIELTWRDYDYATDYYILDTAHHFERYIFEGFDALYNEEKTKVK